MEMHGLRQRTYLCQNLIRDLNIPGIAISHAGAASHISMPSDLRTNTYVPYNPYNDLPVFSAGRPVGRTQ